MALESIKAEPGLASRVIAFNGRYASLPENRVYSHDNSLDSWW
ncbi:esterase YpfH [Escherichia coli]|uniref:Esterase YpfH n=1 Tax=Escherichia coli TaxID=562 RepID=A0A2X3JDY0_ECOLX|nr:esterase YpfH [Escherichia coli]